MIEDSEKKPNIKTYVKGTFLFSDDGLEYKQKNNDGKAEEKVVEDRIGFLSLQQQIQKDKITRADKEKNKKKQNPVVDRPTLIPIKDTPVQPIPEPVQQYQKCQMATQQQFQYFQNYVSQRERQRQAEQVQQAEIRRFLQLKQKKAQEQPAASINIVFVKQQKQKEQKAKRIIKKIIKKKDQNIQEHQKPSKIRMVEVEDKKQ